MGKVDLHVHSTASDGRFSPAEIVRQAAGRGLSVIALTDHDSVEGIPAALEEAAKYPDLRVIPGVEISTEVSSGEVHILGYFVDYKSPGLLTKLERMRNSRLERAQKIVAKLGQLGINIDWPRVQEIAAGGTVGRPHIAQAMLEKAYIGSMKEAFTTYIGHDRPAYVTREKMTQVESVRLILQADGLPVLAHPSTVNDPESLVSELKPEGLAGMECYYDGYTQEEINTLLKVAGKYGLVATGGSDYHGMEIDETVLGSVEVPLQAAEALMALAGQPKAGNIP